MERNGMGFKERFLKIKDGLIQKENVSSKEIEMNPYAEKLSIYKSKLLSDEFYEKKWESLTYRFSKINLYAIQFISMGETTARLVRMVCDLNENKLKQDELHVVLPVFPENYKGGVYNEKALEVFRRYLYIIDDSNIDFWEYILSTHKKEINMGNFTRYKNRQSGYIQVEIGKPIIELTNALLSEAEKKFHKLKIRGDFVCIHAREQNEKKINYNIEYARETTVCDCNINSFGRGCMYLQQNGMQVVRMGKFENNECSIPGMIDCANQYHDELMDFYLLHKCKFMIASNSGLFVLPGYFGRPYIMVNVIAMTMGYESTAFLRDNMYVPKKFWSEKENRYLNLYEILEVTDECHVYASRYRERNIRIIDNTEEEIYEAVLEMNQRMDGDWAESVQEKECMEKYREIFCTWKRKHRWARERKKYKMQGGTPNESRISWNYLKRNLYLLDTDII